MEEKEFNKKILHELVKVAKEVFSNSETREGSFTAAEIANGKDNKGNYLYCQCPNKQYTVCVDSFKCTFNADSVFRLVWKFEQLTKTQAKNKARFTKEKEAKNIICSFDFILPKNAKTLSKVANDINRLRPYFDCVCVDVENGYLVATDGTTVRANETIISNFSGELQKTVLIHKKDFKTLSEGLCRVIISESGATATDKNGVSVPAVIEKYPLWASVIPETNGKNRICITDIKGIYKFLKSSKCGSFSISGNKGDNKVIIKHEKGIFTAQSEILPFDFSFSLPIEKFLNTCPGWDGDIYLSGNQEPIIFGDNAAELVLIRPNYEENKIRFDFDRSEMLPYLEYVKKQEENKLPAIHKANELQAINYINILMSFVKSFVMAFFAAEIEHALKRLHELSEISGIPVNIEPEGNNLPEKETNEPNLQPSDYIAIAAQLHVLLTERIRPNFLDSCANAGSGETDKTPQPDSFHDIQVTVFIPPDTSEAEPLLDVAGMLSCNLGIRIRGSPMQFQENECINSKTLTS